MIDGRNKSATCARKVLDYFFLIGELKKIVGNYFGGGPHTHVYVLRLSSPRKKIFCFLFSHARVRALSFCKKKNFLSFIFFFLIPFFLLCAVECAKVCAHECFSDG